MKSLIIIFGVLLLIIATPFVFASIDDAVTETTTNSFASITDSDNTTVILGTSAWNNTAQSIIAISSNLTADSPTAYSYNSVSRALVVSGLVGSDARTLIVQFRIDSTTLPLGVAVFLPVLRWFYVFIMLGMAGGAIYAFFD